MTVTQLGRARFIYCEIGAFHTTLKNRKTDTRFEVRRFVFVLFVSVPLFLFVPASVIPKPIHPTSRLAPLAPFSSSSFFSTDNEKRGLGEVKRENDPVTKISTLTKKKKKDSPT